MTMLARIETYAYRAAVTEPVNAMLGGAPARTALLVRVEDADGASGWGEIWANFPPRGVESKSYLMETSVAPFALGVAFERPADLWQHLTARTRRLALQSSEPGPFAACIAGLDQAVWDMTARKAGVPIWRALGRKDRPASVPAYASGIKPIGADERIDGYRALGFQAFKVMQINRARDLATVRRITDGLRPGEDLMVDANQGWEMPSARGEIQAFGELPLTWIEEPLPVDDPAEAWADMAMLSGAPLAGGENMLGFAAFDAAITARHLQVIQPDIGKWGGFTGCLAVARRARAAGRRFCPHWLISGIGLMASAHLLAAAGGDGRLEHDVNENPLRELLAQPFPRVTGGYLPMPEGPGLGVAPDLAAAKPFLVRHTDQRVGT